MRKLTYYMFMSLDGFIADRDGGLDWVPIDDELMTFANEYFGSMDGIVFGRKNYELFVSYWDSLDPSKDTSITELDVEFADIFRKMTRIVASRTLDDVEKGAVLIEDDVAEGISALKEQTGRDLLLICGPELMSTLGQAGLVDDYRILVAPKVLGEGRPMFADVHDELRLRLENTQVFGSSGVVMLEYKPAGSR